MEILLRYASELAPPGYTNVSPMTSLIEIWGISPRSRAVGRQNITEEKGFLLFGLKEPDVLERNLESYVWSVGQEINRFDNPAGVKLQEYVASSQGDTSVRDS